jgi:hypothetical protein
MLLFFQKCRNFFHSIMEMIRRGMRNKRDDGILVVSTWRISIDDNPAVRRTRPVFNLQTLRHEGSRINHKVRHLRLRMSFLGRVQQCGTDSEAGGSKLRLGFSRTRERIVGVGEFRKNLSPSKRRV